MDKAFTLPSMPRKKFQMALLSIISFGLILILILNLGVVGNQCTNLDRLIAQHEEDLEEQKGLECKSHRNETFPWQKFRLPGESIPRHYYVFLYPNLEDDSFSGSVSITFESTARGKYVALHGKDFQIRSLSIYECGENDPDCYGDVNDNESQAEVDDYFQSCDALGMIVIRMAHELRAGRLYKLNIKYSRPLGTLPSHGIFRQEYFKELDESGKASYDQYVVTNFAPIAARHVFPCFDEPNYPASFKFDVVRQKDQKVFFNSVFVQKSAFAKASSSNGEFGLSQVVQSHEVDHFEMTSKLPTFLLGFVIGQFKTQSTMVEGISIKLSTVNSVDDRHLAYALSVLTELVVNYKSYLGTLRHLAGLRIVALPNYSVTEPLIQPSGLVFARLEVIFSLNQLEQKMALSTILAQQIFSPEQFLWWDHLWQESGIVNLIAKEVLSQSEKDYIAASNRHRMFHSEKFVTLHDVLPMNLTEMANTVTLSNSMKWSCVLGMFKEYLDWLDDDLFRRTISRRGFNNTVYEDSEITKLVNSQGIDFIDIVTNWTAADFPYIQVQSMGGRISFEQFSLATGKGSEAKWKIPITYDIDTEGAPRMFLLEKEKLETNLETIPQRVLVNQKGTAAYRVLYSSQLLSYIIKAIEVAHDVQSRDRFMTPISRAVFYQDLFHFTKVGKVDYQKLFRLSASLHEENHPVVWKAALDGFDWLQMQLDQALDSRESDWFSKFIISKLIGAYTKTKSLNLNISSQFVAKEYSQIIKQATCRYGHEGCLKDQMEKFENWKMAPITAGDALIPCVAVGYGEEFDTVYSAFNSTADFILAGQLVDALTCTVQLDRIKELLLRSVSPDQPLNSHFSKIILKFSRGKYGHLIVLDFLQSNWNDVTRLCPILSSDFKQIFFNLADLLPNADMLLDLLERRLEEPLKSRSYQNMKNQIQLISAEKQEWNSKFKTGFTCWLRQFYHRTTGQNCENI